MIRLPMSSTGKLSRKEKECEGQHIQSTSQDLLLPYMLMISGGGDHLAAAGMSLGSQGCFRTTLSALLTSVLSQRPFLTLGDSAFLKLS